MVVDREGEERSARQGKNTESVAKAADDVDNRVGSQRLRTMSDSKKVEQPQATYAANEPPSSVDQTGIRDTTGLLGNTARGMRHARTEQNRSSRTGPEQQEPFRGTIQRG